MHDAFASRYNYINYVQCKLQVKTTGGQSVVEYTSPQYRLPVGWYIYIVMLASLTNSSSTAAAGSTYWAGAQ